MNTPKPIVFRSGKRIYLRPVLKEDLSKVIVWVNNEEVHRFIATTKPASVQKEEQWFDSLQKENDQVTFVIVLKEGDLPIGITSLAKIDHLNGTATTGSFIGEKEYWSQGYGTESKMLVLHYAFNTLNLRKINSTVYDFNPRSKKCLEKCGYKVEGVRTAQKFREGRYCDEILLAVFKDEWQKLWENYRSQFLA